MKISDRITIMCLFLLGNHSVFKRLILFLLIFSFIASGQGFAQTSKGVLRGKVLDGSTNRPLFDVTIAVDTDTAIATSADGNYIYLLPAGTHTVAFKLEGFQTSRVASVMISAAKTTYLDILLFPIAQGIHLTNKRYPNDSLPGIDSVSNITFSPRTRKSIYHPIKQENGLSDIILSKNIQPGTDKDGAQLLKRLNSVIIQDNLFTQNTSQSVNISGLGARYNQVLLNGALMNSFDAVNRSYPLALFPAEMISEVSVRQLANPSLPADFSGGTIEIKTKDIPDQNFFYVLAGSGFSAETVDRDFLGDKRGKLEWLGFSGDQRDLPAAFPTTRSQSAFHQKNIQEQVFLSKQLKNNLALTNYGSSHPNDKVLLGFGRNMALKKGAKLGIIAYLNHQKTERIDESVVQAVPDVRGNPYPFADPSKILVRSLSNDIHYRYASHTAATLNAAVLFGRNKISFKAFFINQLLNSYTSRSDLFKPDEDTLAHTGAYYLTEQKRSLTVQLSGEHALGENSRLKINWLASYVNHRQRNPDERSFLLRDSAGFFEIARPTAASLSSVDAAFTNSGRLWRDFTDHNFTGAVNLLFPFNLFRHAQVLSGGIYLQTRYRVLFSDLIHTSGNGYSTLETLLSPEKYYPGGVGVMNYYKRYVSSSVIINPDAIDATHRGNYTGSVNLGASYIRLENRLTSRLLVDWGIRAESNSQLVSTSQYNYFAGYKNAQLGTLDENDRVIQFEVLPSITARYELTRDIRVHASYFKTLNRPELQELSRYRYYDPLSFMVTTGNPLLANSITQHYNAGIDWFINEGTHISINAFYKDIDQPIEYIVSGYANATGNLMRTPYNTPPATVKGITGSFRAGLDVLAPCLSSISIFASGTFLRSEVEAGPVKSIGTPDILKHDLSATPEYSVNAGIVVQYPRLPMLTLLYNRMGDYISMVGSGRIYLLENGNSVSAIPHYRVRGRNQLDIQVSQQFFKSRIQLIAGVNNLLEDNYVEYQDLNGNGKFDAPLVLDRGGSGGGYHLGGVDNTTMSIPSQRTYYLTLSYLFK